MARAARATKDLRLLGARASVAISVRLALGGFGERIRPQQLKELATRIRNSVPAPLAHAWRLDLADFGNGRGSAEVVDDLGVVHVRSVGIPMSDVNRQSYVDSK